MVLRSRTVTARLLRPTSLTSVWPPQNTLVSAARQDLRRPLSSWRQSPRPPSPTYYRFPPKQSPPPPNGGQFFPNSEISRRFAELRWIWQTNARFRSAVLVIVIGGGIFYVYNLERVPVSGRLRFNCISDQWEKAGAMQHHERLLREYRGKILPSGHPSSRMVQMVIDRLAPVTGAGDVSWEAVVIDDPDTVNAFVTSGGTGKVYVFTGILPICHDADGLAAVLGHEIAHTIARHSAERLSRFAIMIPLALLVSISLGVSDQLMNLALKLAWELPSSRKQESEADFIGLLMMSKACFNPEAAIEFWQRMAPKGQFAPPPFLSTHPSHRNRSTQIQEWLPKALEEKHTYGCGSTPDYATEFMKFYHTRTQNDELG